MTLSWKNHRAAFYVAIALSSACFSITRADDQAASAESRAPRAELTTVEGDAVTIAIESIGAGNITGMLDSDRKTWQLDDLARIVPVEIDRAAAEPMRGADVCTFFLEPGGVVHGRLSDQPVAQSGRIKADVGLGELCELDFSGLIAIRIQPGELPDHEPDFKGRIAERKPGSDVMLLMQAGKTVALQGSLEKLDARGWSFNYGGKTRTGPLDRVYGFVFGKPSGRRDAEPARIVRANGDQFPARLMRSARGRLEFQSIAIGSGSIAWREIASIELQSDRLISLSSLKPVEVVQESLAGSEWPWQADKNVTGGPIRIGPLTFAKGVGVHAQSSLSFDLNGEFERFTAAVGIDQSMAPGGSAIFRVVLDGKVLHETGVLRGGARAEPISLSIEGGKRLTLECNPADELDLSDHGNWANATLIRSREKSKS